MQKLSMAATGLDASSTEALSKLLHLPQSALTSLDASGNPGIGPASGQVIYNGLVRLLSNISLKLIIQEKHIRVSSILLSSWSAKAPRQHNHRRKGLIVADAVKYSMIWFESTAIQIVPHSLHNHVIILQPVCFDSILFNHQQICEVTTWALLRVADILMCWFVIAMEMIYCMYVGGLMKLVHNFFGFGSGSRKEDQAAGLEEVQHRSRAGEQDWATFDSQEFWWRGHILESGTTKMIVMFFRRVKTILGRAQQFENFNDLWGWVAELQCNDLTNNLVARTSKTKLTWNTVMFVTIISLVAKWELQASMSPHSHKGISHAQAIYRCQNGLIKTSIETAKMDLGE